MFSGYRTVRITRTKALQACFTRVNPPQYTQFKQDRHVQKHVCKKYTQKETRKIRVNYHKLRVKLYSKFAHCVHYVKLQQNEQERRATCFATLPQNELEMLKVLGCCARDTPYTGDMSVAEKQFALGR